MTFADDVTPDAQTRADALSNWFTYHPPQGDQVNKYQDIREFGRIFAALIADNCPASRERDIAIDKIREAVMWGNASIACKS